MFVTHIADMCTSVTERMDVNLTTDPRIKFIVIFVGHTSLRIFGHMKQQHSTSGESNEWVCSDSPSRTYLQMARWYTGWAQKASRGSWQKIKIFHISSVKLDKYIFMKYY